MIKLGADHAAASRQCEETRIATEAKVKSIRQAILPSIRHLWAADIYTLADYEPSQRVYVDKIFARWDADPNPVR